MSRATVAVDAMGGDHAPSAIVAGAVLAARRGIPIALVGPLEDLRRELDQHDARRLPIECIQAAEAIAMDEAPLAALRRKPGASVKVAAETVAGGAAQALFSAGHTGATFLAAHSVFGVVPGIDRPALAVTVPTRTGRAVLLDAGATVDPRPEHLVQFGVMGASYARIDLNIASPRVGLLSIGEEPGKGNDLIREAHAGFARAPIAFIGNLEARDLFSGRADVIVCDGFTGNIALKVGEGLVDAIEEMLRTELASSTSARLGAWLARGAFRTFKRRVDYAEYGGAPLLGIRAVVVVAHGHSSARAAESGIVMAARLADERVVERLREALPMTA